MESESFRSGGGPLSCQITITEYCQVVISVKNINKMTITEKLAAAEQAKKTPDKKKK